MMDQVSAIVGAGPPREVHQRSVRGPLFPPARAPSSADGSAGAVLIAVYVTGWIGGYEGR